MPRSIADRVGFDPIRGLTYIRPGGIILARMQRQEQEERCLTCGRSSDCCCGAECPCNVEKQGRQVGDHSDAERAMKEARIERERGR